MRLYQVDAFTDRLFHGNPAAVCPLEAEWLPDETMQKIAEENNLSETAFLVRTADRYAIRWFTPKVEVDLCGHATLASAHVLFHHLGHPEDTVAFDSRSGVLTVRRKGDLLAMNFPADTLVPVPVSEELAACFQIPPIKAYRGRSDYLLVFKTEDEIRTLQPDLSRIRRMDARGLIVTARGSSVDFVSRFFAPQVGVDEDPVTGSAHTSLVPFWKEELGKTEFHALQVSSRGGEIFCRGLGDRVEIAGKAVTYFIGDIFIM